MPFIPTFIKPCRAHAKLPDLDRSYAFKASRQGKEVAIVLDLNIVSKMKEVVSGKTAYEDSGLKNLVAKLNKFPLVLAPGFAFAEADEAHIDALDQSWEGFLQRYCPEYVDTPNATNDRDNKARGREFQKLPRADQYLNSISYLAMLKIHAISREHENCPSEEKFKKYVDYMMLKADMLSGIEAEVARYCFFQEKLGKLKGHEIAFNAYAKSIRKNFLKKGNGDARLLNALNAARDIMYYRQVAMQSNETMDGALQDMWLATADEGLTNLAQSVYFLPNVARSDFKAYRAARNIVQKQSPYWKYCDQLFFQCLSDRGSLIQLGESENTEEIKDVETNKLDDWTEKKFEVVLQCIKEQEDIVRSLYISNH